MEELLSLTPMSRELCHEFYREYERDPDTFMDMSLFRHFEYNAKWVDRFFDRRQEPGRVMLAVMCDGKPVGQIDLKHIDPVKKECELSIHMRNDSVKGKGYGTRAEQLALKYAFDVLEMEAVNADAVLKNTRSQHVLEKVGFRYVGEDETCKYYRCEREM